MKKAKQNSNPRKEVFEELFSLHRKGELSLLEEKLNIEIKKFPTSSRLYNLMGACLAKQDRFEEALINFNLSLQYGDKRATILNNIGITQLKLEKFQNAIDTLREAITLDPNYATSHFNLGNAFRKTGKLTSSINSYDKALTLDPNFAKANLYKSLSLKNLGRFDESIEVCNKAINQKEEMGIAHRHLSSMITYKDKNQPHLLEMISIFNSDSLGLDDKIQFAFALGKAFEDIKDFKEAFKYLEIGNRLHRQTFNYSSSTREQMFEDLKQNFSSDFFEKINTDSLLGENIIFVLGMPRSGTSLIEQILSSHSKIYGAGELRLFKEAVDEFFYPVKDKKFPRNLLTHDSSMFDVLGKAYIESVEKLNRNKVNLIVDKMPYNFQYIGMIACCLPGAKIILSDRNPIDNCFSIYKQKFGTGNLYAYSLKEIGEYYNLYKDLMAHWELILPDKIFTVSYEELISEQERTTRNLLKYISLDWEDTCLDFHSTERGVLTASAVQVKQPIYNTSVDLWENYSEDLNPLRKILDEGK